MPLTEARSKHWEKEKSLINFEGGFLWICQVCSPVVILASLTSNELISRYIFRNFNGRFILVTLKYFRPYWNFSSSWKSSISRGCSGRIWISPSTSNWYIRLKRSMSTGPRIFLPSVFLLSCLNSCTSLSDFLIFESLMELKIFTYSSRSSNAALIEYVFV